MNGRNVAITVGHLSPEVVSVEYTDAEPDQYSGIEGNVFVGSTFREAKADAIMYAREERDRWNEALANLRALRAKDVNPDGR